MQGIERHNVIIHHGVVSELCRDAERKWVYALYDREQHDERVGPRLTVQLGCAFTVPSPRGAVRAGNNSIDPRNDVGGQT
jgi:hypothetical protein